MAKVPHQSIPKAVSSELREGEMTQKDIRDVVQKSGLGDSSREEAGEAARPGKNHKTPTHGY